LPTQPPADPKLQATQSSPRASSSEFVPPTPEELAARFPQLEILELLGKGGMGAVYKARQRGLDRLVAVKILPPEVGSDPAFAERFTREARALALLSHPNIVAVHDFGQTDGLYYFVMEYVDGVNLRQTMRAGKIAPKEALAIVTQVCDALQFAHDEGIVHRDIKPENIMIDQRGRAKIADFGLAKLLGQDPAGHNLTATNQVMGTLRYMAPEQLEGSRAVDHRADIYSLGVVFYELLTGELPIGRFAPPSKKVQIDVRLDEVVLRALEKEPEQRYQHANEVKTSVEKITASSPDLEPAFHLEAAAKAGGVPFRFYVKTMFVSALGWLLIPLLSNAREFGLFLACTAMAALIVWTARRAQRFLPATVARWRQRSALARWALMVIAFLYAAAGVYLLFVGCYQAWDRFHWNSKPVSYELFQQEYQGAEQRLLRQLREYQKDVPRAELVCSSFGWNAGWCLGTVAEPSPRVFNAFLFVVSLLFGVWLVFGGYITLFSDKPLWTPFGWKPFGWPAVGLALATLLPLAPYAFALMLGFDRPYVQEWRVNEDMQFVVNGLDNWAEENGYVQGDFSGWKLYAVPGNGSALANVEVKHLWQPNVFDRWQMTTTGLQRKSPDLVLEIVSSAKTKETAVTVFARTRRVEGTESHEINEAIESLRQAINAKAKSVVLEPKGM